MGNNIIYLVMDSQRTVNKKRKVVQMKNGIGIGKGNRLWLLKLKFFWQSTSIKMVVARQ
jgi:hypothetical protein